MAITIDGTDGISPLKISGQTQTTTGTAAAPAIASSSDTDSGFFFGTNEVNISTGGSTRATVDSSGHLGLGTTSPAALGGDGGRVLHVAGANNPEIVLERTTSGTEFKSSIRITDGENTTFCIKDGSASSINAMSIDPTGRLFVGTTSELLSGDEKKLQITNADAGAEIILGRNDTSVTSGNSLGGIKFVGNDSNGTYQQGAKILAIADGTHGNNDKPTRLAFSVTADGASSPTERMRIDNTGRTILHGTSTSGALVAETSQGAASNKNIIVGGHSASSIDGGTGCFVVLSNGNVVNTNNSYGALSDVKLKENIVDAPSQWDDIKAVQVRNYNLKESTRQQTHTQLGVVAQEIETVSPGLVSESPDLDADGNDLGTVTKSVNYSVLYMKAVKALQEAQTRIETLETQHADLLARVTALEAA